MSALDAAVVAAVLRHMNDDHADDSLRIVRAHGSPDATAATMTGYDADAGHWQVEPGAAAVQVPWPGGPVVERADVRREVVALHDEACRRLGLEPRPH